MKRSLFACLAAATVASLSLSTTAVAKPQSTPNGPWVQPEQEVSRSSFTSNEELGAELKKLEKRSKGLMELEVVGESATGWPLYLAKFGEPSPEKTEVLVLTQIHGGEPLGTEAVLQLMQNLVAGGAESRHILDEVTVWFLPRLNMDGAAYTEDGKLVQRRHNIQEWIPEEWGLSPDAPAPWNWNHNPYSPEPVDPHGYDVNRDFHPDLDFRLSPGDEDLLPGDPNDFGFFATPEARAAAGVFQRLQPDVYIDHHHRGNNLQGGDDPRLTTLQINGDITRGRAGFPLDPEVHEKSLQLNRYVYDHLGEIGNNSSPFDAITRYRDIDLPSTALGAFQLNGAAVMLYEVRGGIGQKSSGMLIQQSYRAIRKTLLGLADDEIWDVDADLYWEIPPAGPGVSNPRS